MLHRHCLALAIATTVVAAYSSAGAQDWMFDKAPYTNNPKTGQRVEEYKAKPKVDRISAEKFYSINGPHPFGPEAWESAPWQLLEGPEPYAGGYGYNGSFGSYGSYGTYGGFGGYGGGFYRY
jgi:hypothetical protein